MQEDTDKIVAIQNQNSELQNKLEEIKVENASPLNKYEAILTERAKLYSKIKSLEDLLFKRDQTNQTIQMNLPKDTV